MSGDFKLRSSKRLCSQNIPYSPSKNSKNLSPGNRTDEDLKHDSKTGSNQKVYKKHENHGDSREVKSLTEDMKKEMTTRSIRNSPKFLKSMSPISPNKRGLNQKDVANNIRKLRNQRHHAELESDHQSQTKEKIKQHKSEENIQSKITDLYCKKKRLRSQEKISPPKTTQTLTRESKETARISPQKDKVVPFPTHSSKTQVVNVTISKSDNSKLEHSYASTKHTPVKNIKPVHAGKECDFAIRRSPRFKDTMTEEITSKQSVAHQHKSMTEGKFPFSMKTKNGTTSSKSDIHPSDKILLKPQTIHPPLKSVRSGLPGLLDQCSLKSRNSNTTKAPELKNTLSKLSTNVERQSRDGKEKSCQSSDVKTDIKNPKSDRKSLEGIDSLSNNCKSNNDNPATTSGQLKGVTKSLEASGASNHCQPKTINKINIETLMNKPEVIVAPRRSPRIKIEHCSSLQLPSIKQDSLLTRKVAQNNQSNTLHVQRISNIAKQISPRKLPRSEETPTVPSQISNDVSIKSPRMLNKARHVTQPTRKSPRQSNAGKVFTTSDLCLPLGRQTHREYTIIKSHEALCVEMKTGKQTSGISALKKKPHGTNSSKLGIEAHSTIGIIDAKLKDFSGSNTINETGHGTEIKSPSNSRNVRRKIDFVSKPTSDNKSVTVLKDDDSDDEYIPRRKKLRSEVTESELWEGFPPNIRFKRLTPKKKINMEIVPEQKSSGYDITQTNMENDRMSVQNNEEKGNLTDEDDGKKSVCSVDNDVQKEDETKSVESNDKHQANKKVIAAVKAVIGNYKRKHVSDFSNEGEKDEVDLPEAIDEKTDQVNGGANRQVNEKESTTTDNEHKSKQVIEENKTSDQKVIEENQCSAKENKVENHITRKTSNEIVQQIFDINTINKDNNLTTNNDVSITKVRSENVNNLQSIAESTATNLDILKRNEELVECSSAESTPRKKKDSNSNVTPKRSARLQKKISASKKNDVYVYTPLKRHDNLEEKKPILDATSNHIHNKITNHTTSIENAKQKIKLDDVSKRDGDVLTDETKGTDKKESELDSRDNIKEVANNVDGICLSGQSEEKSELPHDIVEKNSLVHENIDTNDNVSKSTTEINDEVCDQVKTNHGIENTVTRISISGDTLSKDKTIEEEKEEKEKSSKKSVDETQLSANKEVSDCIGTQNVQKTFIEEFLVTKDKTGRTLKEDQCMTENVNMKTPLTTVGQMTTQENNVDQPCENVHNMEELKDGLTIKSNINEHSDKVNKDMKNDTNDKECDNKDEFKEPIEDRKESDQERESLKIKMKKTRTGATIIHPKPSNLPFVLLPRITIPHSSSISQCDERNRENKIESGANKNNKDKNKSQAPATTKKSKITDKRQLRSSEECDELRLETTPELERTKKSGKVFKQRKRKSNDKSPLKKSKRRVSSPKKSEAMRKKDDAQRLLANKTLEKHACILWSSGQRRHFQMSNPEASHAEIDDIMRKAWEQMTDKEKLGYFQRANNAMTDEYKHSTPKQPEIPEKLPQIKECKKMLKFMSLSPAAQHEELQKWLRLFYEISAGEYSKLMLDFKEVLKQKRSELKEKYKEHFKQKDAEYQSFYRKLLFRKILDIRDKIVDIYEQKIERQQIILKEAFDSTVRKLIAGEDLEFSKGERSEALTEVLIDLKDLESDLKIAVSGAPISTRSFENVLDGLQQELEDVSAEAEDRKETPDQQDVSEPNSDYAQQLLIQSSTTDLPILDVNFVDTVLNAESEMNTECLVDDQSREVFSELSKFFDREAANAYERLQKENDKQCCELNNPSCLLTNWMLSDQFHALSRPYNQMTRNDRMLVDSKQMVQFLKGTGPYNVVALPASTIPPNMRRASARRGYNSNSKITTNYNNNNSILNNRMLETQRSRPAITALPYTGRTSAIQKPGVPRIVQTRVPSLPGHTLLRFTSTSSGGIRIHTNPPTH